jgi:hypothetical protein
MSQHQAEGGDDDLSTFLLKRLALHKQELEIDKMFQAVVKLEGSDLHLRVGSPPMVRTKGELRAFNRAPLEAEEMVRLVIPMLDQRAQRRNRNSCGKWRTTVGGNDPAAPGRTIRPCSCLSVH